MNRRKFLATALAAPLANRLVLPKLTANDFSPQSIVPGWRYFYIITAITLPDTAGPAQLWVPVAQTAGSYQMSLSLDWGGTGHTEHVHDARYGAPILRTNWEEKDRADRRFEARQIVAVHDRSTVSPFGSLGETSLAPLTEAERKFWTAPTESMPSNGEMLALSAKITSGKNTPRERLRAIYDWVIDHTYRDADVPGCGRGDITAIFKKDPLGGKCADTNGLMVALARSAGFPARDVYGIRLARSRLYPSLGAGDSEIGGEVSGAQHCRAEVFLDEEGWFPVDPADVRKVMQAEKFSPDSEETRALRDRLFGYWEMNWVGYNSATDIELPGSDGSHKPDFAFLMYPCVFTAEGNCLCTDPAKFSYGITSREFKA